MLKILKFKGGLGNQMFQYAFFLSLKERHSLSWYLFDNEESLYCHDGITLENVFGIKMAKRAKWFRRIRRHLPRVVRHAHRVEQKNALQYDDSYFDEKGLVTLFDGYWQSDKYFAQIADEIRKAFCFREEWMNSRTIQLSEMLKGGNYVSVHIRRGDYLPLADYHGLCSESYYRDAIRYMKEHCPDSTFVFFSDDISWVKENLSIPDSIHVDWNVGKDSWQDMYLMSQCKHNIIANSSFSWWGAWLNSNPEKIVIAPKQWFKFSPNYDIIPDGWITIDC